MLLSIVFFFQSYHDIQLSLFRSISGLPVLSEHHVLSSVTEISGRERIIFMKVCTLIEIKAHTHSIDVQIFKSQIINQTHY